MKKNKVSHDNEKDSFAKRHDQKIKCDVENCAYNDSETSCCELPEIKVSSEDDPTTEKDTTICDSFECKEEDCCDEDCCDEEDQEDDDQDDEDDAEKEDEE